MSQNLLLSTTFTLKWNIQIMEYLKIAFAIFIALILSLQVRSDGDDCLYPCTEIYDPICGDNGTHYKFFGSDCSMQRNNYCYGHGEHKSIQFFPPKFTISFRSICCNQWNKLSRIPRQRILFKKISFQLILCMEQLQPQSILSSADLSHDLIFFLPQEQIKPFSHIYASVLFSRM